MWWLVMTWRYHDIDGRPAPRQLMERRVSSADDLVSVFERYVGGRPEAVVNAAAAATSWAAPIARR